MEQQDRITGIMKRQRKVEESREEEEGTGRNNILSEVNKENELKYKG